MIEFHADDYGLFPEQSKRILKTIDEGACNGVSIMPNSSYMPECMELLGDRKVYLTVHLNLYEGKPLSDTPADKNPLLSEGVFNIGYGKLLMASYMPGLRRKYFEEIKKEYKAQILNCLPYFKGQPVRLDSHVHYHEIPVCFDAMMAAYKEIGCKVSYIRMPYENLKMFASFGKNISKPLPINVVKARLLRVLCRRNRKKYAKELETVENKAFSGVLYSGEMKKENSSTIKEYFRKNDINAELLFHPGAVFEKEDIEKITAAGDREFLTSENRTLEAEALISFKQKEL